MKKIAVLFLSVLTFIQAHGATRRGQVLCDTASPTQKGFVLVELRSQQKSYSGSYDADGLRLKGSYNPADESFTLRLSRYNEETEEDGAFLAESTLRLGGFDYTKFALVVPATAEKSEKLLELFCRIHWN